MEEQIDNMDDECESCKTKKTLTLQQERIAPQGQQGEAEHVHGYTDLAIELAVLVQTASKLPVGHRGRDGCRVTS